MLEASTVAVLVVVMRLTLVLLFRWCLVLGL